MAFVDLFEGLFWNVADFCTAGVGGVFGTD